MADILISDLYTESQYQQHNLGEMAVDKWGNRFRYVQAGGTNLVTGNLLQEAAEDTNYRSMNVAATQSIGDTEITVDLGGTAVTANQFESGNIWIESSTGIGQNFRITRHDVQTATTGECTFYLDRGLAIAITVDATQASVRKNAYDGVIQYPATTQTGGAVGVALYAMTASYYGWIQSGGDCPCLFDTGTNTSNGVTQIVPSAAVAGSVKPAGADGANGIGFSREVASVDSTMGMCHLTID
jgi:hypothetical protein